MLESPLRNMGVKLLVKWYIPLSLLVYTSSVAGMSLVLLIGLIKFPGPRIDQLCGSRTFATGWVQNSRGAESALMLQNQINASTLERYVPALGWCQRAQIGVKEKHAADEILADDMSGCCGISYDCILHNLRLRAS